MEVQEGLEGLGGLGKYYLGLGRPPERPGGHFWPFMSDFWSFLRDFWPFLVIFSHFWAILASGGPGELREDHYGFGGATGSTEEPRGSSGTPRGASKWPQRVSRRPRGGPEA